MRAGRLVLLCVLGLVPAAEAATISAGSCSRSDVGTAVNSARDGDTIVIPPGTCTWTTSLSISGKHITLAGSGINRTIIIDMVPKATYGSPAQVLRYDMTPGGLSRITGITFRGGANNTDDYNQGMVQVGGATDQFRFDNNSFELVGSSGLFVYGWVRGVIDHNTFYVDNWRTGLYTHNGSSWAGVGDYGDNSWATPAPLGTSDALFIEDNTFTTAGFGDAIDGWNGGRYVYRHNTNHNATVQNHGTETSGRWRSLRAAEIYENTFIYDNPSVWNGIIASRGGTGVYFNNSAQVSGGAYVDIMTSVVDLRQSDTSRPYVFGFCNGSNRWDGNQDGFGYPCLDQPGRGVGGRMSGYGSPTDAGVDVTKVLQSDDLGPARSLNQASEPVYNWNNTVNGQVTPMITQSPDVVREGRDFFNQPKPGYTPYAYPHPLVNGTVPVPPPSGSSAPAAPQNLRVISSSQ